MINYDAEKAARVWERVHSAPAAPEDLAGVLPSLIADEGTAAATYLLLSRRYQGREAQLLRSMYQEEQSHAACLKGIYTLITGEHVTVNTPQVPMENTEAVLRRCYGAQMRSLAAYEQWSNHREYGPVFARLVQQEREHCRILLEILGSLRKR